MALNTNYMQITLNIFLYLILPSLLNMKCVSQTAYLTYPLGYVAEMNLKFNIIQTDLLIFSNRPPQVNIKQTPA